jgi:hypothetical protein
MSLYYVGLVAPIDYPDLYALCDGRLPDTFEEWRIIEDQVRRDLVAAGHHVIGLHIDVVALRDYCRSNRIRTDMAALHALATQIGNREFATQREYAILREQTVVVEDVRTGTVAEEEAAGGPLVRAPRQYWWQRWRRPVYAREQLVVDARTGTVIDEDLTPVAPQVSRRRWWQIWRRRPVYADTLSRQPTWRDAPRRVA